MVKIGSYWHGFDKLIEGATYRLDGRNGAPPEVCTVIHVDREAGTVTFRTESGQRQTSANSWNHRGLARRCLIALPEGVAESDQAPAPISAPAPERPQASRAVLAPAAIADLVARIDALEVIARESKEYLAELVDAARSRGDE